MRLFTLRTRFNKQLPLKFGVYEKVFPEATTPCRSVPDHIVKPRYKRYCNNPIEAPAYPEVKDINKIEGMRKSCKLAANLLKNVEGFIKIGITTDKIDEFVHEMCIASNAYPSPLYYKGFPKSICTSVNNIAVHGIPDLRPLHDGDIINVDITVYYEGFHGDCSKTFLIGDVDDRGKKLVQVTEECLDLAIKACGPDVPFNTIGSVIHKYASKNHLTVLPAILGHGIGEYFHGQPDIYHTHNRCPGLMKPGMTFTIEPAISHGSEDTVILEDDWTVVTKDGSRVSQVEHTILITENGAEILTK